MDDISDLWPGLRLVERVEEGNRNEVWRATFAGRDVAVRRSRRSAASLCWELELLGELASHGFRVPSPIRSADGSLSRDGVVVQEWIHGTEPTSRTHWSAVATELARLHATFFGTDQRPGCAVVTELGRASTSVDADISALPDDVAETVLGVFESMSDAPVSLVHGDPGPSNIRIRADGSVALLDWDESRVDVTWHDLSNLGVTVLDGSTGERATRLSHAWEAANAWVTEPAYARRRYEELR